MRQVARRLSTLEGEMAGKSAFRTHRTLILEAGESHADCRLRYGLPAEKPDDELNIFIALIEAKDGRPA